MRVSLRFICAAIVLYAMAGMPGAVAQTSSAVPLTPETRFDKDNAKGVVLFSVRWDRRWKCAGFENAQLRLLAFDKLPSSRTNADEGADLLVADAPLVMTKPRFDHYAFLVEPGEYAISGLHIKVAKSASDVGLLKAGREKLLKDGRAAGGSFTVQPGEVVYIGHFYLDCYGEPILWRYYLNSRDAFNEYLADTRKKYTELDVSTAQFRLFRTTVFGQDFELGKPQ